MKIRRAILISFIIIVSQSAFSQYKTFAFGPLSYETECFYNKGGFVTIRMKLKNVDTYKVELMVSTRDEYDGFINRLKLCKQKMTEWDSVCVKNGITNVDKLIDYKPNKNEGFTVWFGEYFNAATPTMAYNLKDGKSKVTFYTGIIQHLTNKHITCNGGVLVFYSPAEIQEMIDALDLKKVSAYIDDKNRKANLLN